MRQRIFEVSVSQESEPETLYGKTSAVLEFVGSCNEYKQAHDVLVRMTFCHVSKAEAEHICAQVKALLPGAKYLGLAVFWHRPHIEEADTSRQVNFCCDFFQKAGVTLYEAAGCCHHLSGSCRRLGALLHDIPDVKAVAAYCAGMHDDIEEAIEGFSAQCPDVPIFGAMAGGIDLDMMNSSQEVNPIMWKKAYENMDAYVVGSQLYSDGAVVAVYHGKALEVKADYVLGWQPLGKGMEITEVSDGNCVEAIDGIPAISIYERYLGVVPDERHFMENVSEFPLLVERNGLDLARMPLAYDRKGRLYFNGDMRCGDRLRLSYAVPTKFLQGTWLASEEMRKFGPESLNLVICGGRSMFLQENSVKEISAYQRLLGHISPVCGFAELYYHHGRGGILNSALVAVGMRESPEPYVNSCPCYSLPEEKAGAIPLSQRLAVFLDQTTKELKESNELLREKAQEAEAASQAKSQFLSNMSHEIRTPINAVLGMNEMILREAGDETILEYARNIQSAGNSLLGLVNDILDFSKIEAGKLDIIPVEFALSSVINDLVNMIRMRVDKKGLELKLDISPELPSVLYGDEIRIKQVITNILTNAVKYTERGSVTLRMSGRQLGPDHGVLYVSVEDTGIGIKEEDRQKLFSAFERIEEQRNRSIEGTGLGMNITQRLLELMDSHIEIQSAYGKGSTFSFTLPIKVVNWEVIGDFQKSYRHTAGTQEEYHQLFTAPEARLLVVDDTLMNLTVVKGLLKATHVQLDFATSGQEALQLARKNRYDLIFLDHRMPGMDGIETLQHLRQETNLVTPELPIIALTANAVSGARAMYIEAGFSDYLTKPINGRLLEQIIAEHLPSSLVHTESVGAEDEPVPDEDLPAWLRELPCLDTEQGIANCGSVANYLLTLEVFFDAIGSAAEEIENFFDTCDWRNYTIKVHALKSTARIIGAGELFERARRLEDAGNAGYVDELKKDTPELLRLYRSYLKKLAPLKKEAGEQEDKPLLSLEQLQEAYEALKEIAASFDYDSAVYVLENLRAYRVPESEQQRCQAICQAASKPDWEALARLLR